MVLRGVSVPTIKKVVAREVLDSRGFPTVEVDVWVDNNILGRAAVPSGASTGEREALELRDGDRTRYLGRGVQKAVKNVNDIIAPRIKGMDVAAQDEIDAAMIKVDGSLNKSRLGANAILGVSLAVAKAASRAKDKLLCESLGGGTTLPCPFLNIINGGAHADNNLDFQEFMIVPGGFETFSRAVQASSEVFHTLKGILKKKDYFTGVGDEGGFAPKLKSHEEALDLMMQAIEAAGYKPGKDIALALDTASSEFFESPEAKPKRDPERALAASLAKYDLVTESQLQNAVIESQQTGKSLPDALISLGYVSREDITLAMNAQKAETGRAKYRFKKSDHSVRTSDQMIAMFETLVKTYPIVSIEDGLAENDWDGWAQLTKVLGKKVQLVGDDLFVTNVTLLRKGIEKKVANAILIKPNQIGTLTETADAIKLAKKNKYGIMVSHRSGETEDTTIAHIAVAFDAGMIKTGSMSRSDRMAKYNELLRIEEALGKKGKYAGFSAIAKC